MGIRSWSRAVVGDDFISLLGGIAKLLLRCHFTFGSCVVIILPDLLSHVVHYTVHIAHYIGSAYITRACMDYLELWVADELANHFLVA